VWGLAAVILVAGTSFLGACGEQKPKQDAAEQVLGAQQRTKAVKAQADLQAIRTALQAYQLENGRYPDRLEALPLVQDMRIDTSWYAYDPGTGEVRMRER
jgi:hypothetical protein